MDACMGEWMAGWRDRWMDGWMDGLMDGHVVKWVSGCESVDAWTDAWAVGTGWWCMGSTAGIVILAWPFARLGLSFLAMGCDNGSTGGQLPLVSRGHVRGGHFGVWVNVCRGSHLKSAKSEVARMCGGVAVGENQLGQHGITCTLAIDELTLGQLSRNDGSWPLTCRGWTPWTPLHPRPRPPPASGTDPAVEPSSKRRTRTVTAGKPPSHRADEQG